VIKHFNPDYLEPLVPVNTEKELPRLLVPNPVLPCSLPPDSIINEPIKVIGLAHLSFMIS